MPMFLDVPPVHSPVVITKDYGGFVSRYENAAFDYKEKGIRVEIRGDCRSACTLALTVPNVCVDKNAVVAWHQAYEPDTNRLRPDVTNRMLANLPTKIREHLQGKIQKSYTTDTVLRYEQLVELGVKDCDAPDYKAPTVAANVVYEPSNVEAPALTPEQQKEVDWAKYWEFAANTSKAQFGKINMKKYQMKGGITSINIYYWDKAGMYVSAIQYTKDDIAFQRKICRAVEVVPDEMTCTDWMTEKKTVFEYDDFTGRYEQARN